MFNLKSVMSILILVYGVISIGKMVDILNKLEAKMLNKKENKKNKKMYEDLEEIKRQIMEREKAIEEIKEAIKKKEEANA